MLTGRWEGFKTAPLAGISEGGASAARTGFVIQLLQEEPEPAADSQLCRGNSEVPGPSLCVLTPRHSTVLILIPQRPPPDKKAVPRHCLERAGWQRARTVPGHVLAIKEQR